jgi:hypothetical protein
MAMKHTDHEVDIDNGYPTTSSFDSTPRARKVSHNSKAQDSALLLLCVSMQSLPPNPEIPTSRGRDHLLVFAE